MNMLYSISIRRYFPSAYIEDKSLLFDIVFVDFQKILYLGKRYIYHQSRQGLNTAIYPR